jgi:inorganic pyrophosphatase
MDSQSLSLARQFLGNKVIITIDRQLGSKHPKWGFEYLVNYGFVAGTTAPDGEELDAYLLLVDQPVTEYTGVVVAIIHRTDNDDDKLIVIPEGQTITDSEIERLTEFQEKFFKHEILRV